MEILGVRVIASGSKYADTIAFMPGFGEWDCRRLAHIKSRIAHKRWAVLSNAQSKATPPDTLAPIRMGQPCP
ncbi:hypothetical protein PPUN110474_27900 [Pseudomonas putida]|nr:hypothetical protein PPUN110474_27900 [Pseudomonas putida]